MNFKKIRRRLQRVNLNRKSKALIIAPLLVVLLIGGVSAKRIYDRNVQEQQNENFPSIYDSLIDESATEPEPEPKKDDEPKDDKPQANTNQQTYTPPETQAYVPDPCLKLKSDFLYIESDYFRLGGDYIDIIHKELVARYSAADNEYSDLQTVVDARAATQILLDKKWSEVNSAYSAQKNKGCGEARQILKFTMPAISGNPHEWSLNAYDVLFATATDYYY